MNINDVLAYGGVSFKSVKDLAKGRDISDNFFKPIKSGPRFFFKTATVATAPFVFTGITTYFIIEACFDLCSAIVNCFINWDNASSNLDDAIGAVLATVVFAVLAVVSPVINLVDLVGSGINSFNFKSTDGDKDHSAPTPIY